MILRSAEVNLSPLGQPDVESSVLSNLDLVIGSFHSALRRPEDQTDRYLSALRNKNVHILGHPETGAAPMVVSGFDAPMSHRLSIRFCSE